jgi:transposase InsO family protein
MSLTRLLITAVVVEKRPVREVASSYGVSRSWLYELVARYRREGEAAFEPRSRRPRSNPHATAVQVLDLIVELREKLTTTGLDAGPDTIVWHLAHHHEITVSRATVARHLTKAGLVVPEPNKRPKSSFTRFEAAMPNECWQADFTHFRLAGDRDVEVLSWLDDHSRYALRVTAHVRVTGSIVLDAFRDTVARHGTPASTLTDNGMVFTTRLSGGKGGRNGFEHELRRLGVVQKNSRPSRPTTCGKVERFQQTLKNWLRAQPDQPRHPRAAADPTGPVRRPLQPPPATQLAAAASHPRHHLRRPTQGQPGRPHRRHPRPPPARPRRHGGKITLRHGGRLYSIGIGRTHTRTRVVLLVQDLHVRVVNATTGELLRQLVLDPTKDYQPTGAPKGPTRK